MDANRLIELFEEIGFDIRRGYRGRGMIKPCVGIVVDDPLIAFAEIVETCGDTEWAANLLRSARQDGMGRSIIIYWPRAVDEEVAP